LIEAGDLNPQSSLKKEYKNTKNLWYCIAEDYLIDAGIIASTG
jgi:hypothetical protein